MSKRIDTLYAYICVEDDGGEGVPGITTPDGWMMPLMGGDPDRMHSLRHAAQAAANMTGRPVHLCVFRGREEVAVIQPMVESKP